MRATVTLGLLLATLLLPGPSMGHVVRFPRLVHVRFEPDRVAVALAVQHHPGPIAGRLRSQFDLDLDGALSEPEQDALGEWLDREGRQTVRLGLDGLALGTVLAERKVELARDNDSATGEGLTMRSVEEIGISLRPGRHTLMVKDTPYNPGTVVPWRIDLPDGWTVVESSTEGGATAAVRAGEQTWQTAFSGDGGRVELIVEVPERAADR